MVLSLQDISSSCWCVHRKTKVGPSYRRTKQGPWLSLWSAVAVGPALNRNKGRDGFRNDKGWKQNKHVHWSVSSEPVGRAANHSPHHVRLRQPTHTALGWQWRRRGVAVAGCVLMVVVWRGVVWSGMDIRPTLSKSAHGRSAATNGRSTVGIGGWHVMRVLAWVVGGIAGAVMPTALDRERHRSLVELVVVMLWRRWSQQVAGSSRGRAIRQQVGGVVTRARGWQVSLLKLVSVSF